MKKKLRILRQQRWKHTSILEILGVLIVLLLSIFFRFYRLVELQYYSFDDEVYTLVVRKIVILGKLIFLSPNATLGVSFGSFHHLLSAPIFWFAHLDPIKILSFGSFLGVVTTFLIYATGKELSGKRVGLFASFLYATSFLAALSDRRWWTLSLNPLLITVAIFSLIKIMKGSYFFTLPLVITASFAWHADLTLAVIPLAGLLFFIFFRVPILHKKYMWALLYLLFSFSPFLVFELFHPGAISHPWAELFQRFGKPRASEFSRVPFLDIHSVILGISNSLFASPSQTGEDYLVPHIAAVSPDVPLILKLIALLLFFLPILSLTNKKNANQASIKLLVIFFCSSIFGVIATSILLKHFIYQHYYITIWPALFLLAGFTLSNLFQRKYFYLSMGILLLVLHSNLSTLIHTGLKYPLFEKMQVVNYGLSKLTNEPFSLQVLGGDIYLDSGGFGGLFALKGRFPSNKSYYYFDWLYRSYSLYEVPIRDDNYISQKIVIYPRTFQPLWSDLGVATPSAIFEVGMMKTAISKLF